MKKSVVLWSMVVLSFIGLASGCQPQNDASSAPKQSRTTVVKKKKTVAKPVYQQLADKNQTALADKYKQAPTLTYTSNDDVINWVEPTVKDIVKDSTPDGTNSVILGYVTDWEQVNDPNLRIMTKLKVQVQKVFDGDTKLANQTITVSYVGGYVPYRTLEAYAGKREENINPETTVLAQYENLPTPKIGTTLVMPIRHFPYKNAVSWYRESAEKGGLANSYQVISDAYTTWILDPKTDKLTNNNPTIPDTKPEGDNVPLNNTYKVKEELEKKLSEDTVSDS